VTKYTKTKTKKRRAALARNAGPSRPASVATASPAAMGPLEAETDRLAVEVSRTYRKAMGAAQARRVEQLAPAVPSPVKGFVGLAALRRRTRDDDDDLDVAVATKHPKVEPVTSVEIAARLMLARQVDALGGLAVAVRSGSPVVVVDVPDAAMLDRLGRVWESVLMPATAVCVKFLGSGALRHGQYDALYVVAKTPTKPKDSDDTRRLTLDALGLALPVIAFSPSAETHLPAELLLACTHRIAIPALDARTIVRTIEIVTGRTCRARLDDVTVARTGLGEIAIAVRFDRTPAECVAGLRRLAEAKAVKRGSRDLTLDELHGMDSAVAWARSAIVDLNSWRRGDVGSWSAVSSKVLLNGPPGTGKTTFAAVFARAAGLPIVTASLAGWQSQGHLGDLLKAMRTDFEKARNLANSASGCVMFIDEVDAFADRSSIRHDHADYVIQVVSGFLELTDGLAGNENLFLVAACNDVRRCDPALVRPGRFNPVIEIGLPNLADLEKMFRVRLGPDLVDADLREICERTLGGSGAEVERIVNDARRLARHDGARSIVMHDLLSIVKGEDARPEALRRRTAIHEAGHIVVDVLFNGGAGIHASISPSRGTGGRVVRTEATETAGTYEDYARRLQVLLAGRTAEILMCGDCGHGSGGVAGSDMAVAASMAAAMSGSVGLSGSRPLLFLAPRENTPELLSYPEVRLAANEELTKAADACRALLQRHRGALEAVTEVLLAEGRIDGEGVCRLLATANPPGGAAGGAATRLPGRADGAGGPRIRNTPTRRRKSPPSRERRAGTAPGKPL
jgi:cell division protease FtsH